MSGYKLKTKKSASKRFSLTANGKVKKKHAGLRHFMRRKSSAKKRLLRSTGFLAAVNAAVIKRLLH